MQKGTVTVNGIRAEIGQKIDPEKDTVCWNGRVIRQTDGHADRTYILLNKPIGYVTTMKDEKGRQVAADLLHGVTERVYPVGRLDMYSEGMLLFTNDGDLTNRLTHPAHHIPKKYVVTIRGTLTAADAARFTEPMTLDGYALRPVEATLLTAGERLPDGTAVSTVELTLHEGRNRQIRRMCDILAFKVIRLCRVSIGDIRLGNLPRGKWRHLTKEEVRYLKAATNSPITDSEE
jgi:pseudouridine synthase